MKRNIHHSNISLSGCNLIRGNRKTISILPETNLLKLSWNLFIEDPEPKFSLHLTSCARSLETTTFSFFEVGPCALWRLMGTEEAFGGVVRKNTLLKCSTRNLVFSTYSLQEYIETIWFFPSQEKVMKVVKCWGWAGRSRLGCEAVQLHILGALPLNWTRLLPHT